MTLTDFINNLYGAECDDGELAQLAKLHTMDFAQKISEAVSEHVGPTSRVSVSLTWLDKRPYASPVSGFPEDVFGSPAGRKVTTQAQHNRKVELADLGIFIINQCGLGSSAPEGTAILLQAKLSRVKEGEGSGGWKENFFKLCPDRPCFRMISEKKTNRDFVDKPMDVSSKKEWYLLTKNPSFYLLPGPNSNISKENHAFFECVQESKDSENLAARFMFANRGKSFSSIGSPGCHWVTAAPEEYLTFDLGLDHLIEQMVKASPSLGKSFKMGDCGCGDGECHGAKGASDHWSRLCNCILKYAGESDAPKRYFSNKRQPRLVSSISFIGGREEGPVPEPEPGCGAARAGFLAVVIRILHEET